MRRLISVWSIGAALGLCQCAKTIPAPPAEAETASPVEAYIASMHRRIHVRFAEGFLPALPPDRDRWVPDHELATRLEIVVERDGALHRIGLVGASGLELFDEGAFQSVVRAQPFGEPPIVALSGDGRAYLHWSFHRNERKCGTYETSLFVLTDPVNSAAGVERLEPGGVVPPGTPAVWGRVQSGEHWSRGAPGAE